MKLAQNVSIVVITHNRSKFIARMALALNKLDFGGKLIVSESSSEENFIKSQNLIKNLNLEIQITHIHTPKNKEMTISQSMNFSFQEGIKGIETDYAMLTCDDDIPIPETLEKCQKFLDEQGSYNGVNGELPWYEINSASEKNNIFHFLGLKSRVKCNRTFGLEETTALGRLDQYLQNFYHTMFTVVRVTTYQNIFPPNTNEISFPHFCADYNWMFGIALTGKIKHFDEPQVVRQFHGENLGIKGENHPFPSYIESLATPSWSNDARLFKNNLTTLIMNLDTISEEEASKAALEALRKITILRLYKAEKNLNLKVILNRIKSELLFMRYRLPISNNYKLYQNTISALTEYKHGF
ncbi:TIGR00180 family glycosyltransferase [Methylophaga sp.]|uniref:TIGR00180 family glycosyltransferase n=1 Tax=Methylophaga sp. TaxID=2024840 RepID=UPI0025F14D5C|nr:TIGR00180 family glycosyltransferase [Methylophaga sp.]